MLSRMLLASFMTVAVAGLAPIQDAHARDGYRDRNRCDTCGRVVSVESIGYRGRDNRVGGGAVVGAIAGGLIGNTVGKGDGRKVATVAGALAGGAVGHNVQKRNSRNNYHYRILVRMDRDGRTRAFEQQDSYNLRRGDRVHVDRGYVAPARR